MPKSTSPLAIIEKLNAHIVCYYLIISIYGCYLQPCHVWRTIFSKIQQITLKLSPFL
jgi:hypothetical protein